MRIVIACFILMATQIYAVPAGSWEFEKASDIRLWNFWNKSGNSFTKEICREVKTPDGKKCLKFKINLTSDGDQNYYKQAICIYTKPVSTGEKYRLSFYYKGNLNGNISLNVSQNTKPYSALGEKCSRTIPVHKEWRKFSFDFEVDSSFAPPLAMPRFMFGQYPEKGILYIGPVTLERLNPVIPLALAPEWQFSREDSSIDTVPGNVKTVKLADNKLDIAALTGGVMPGKTVTLYNRFDAKQDGMMQVGMSADWFFDCYVNGKKIFSTMQRGNISHKFVPDDNVFNFPVKQGKNLLCVRVKSGSKGWRFVCGKVDFVKNPVLAKLFKVTASAKYRPVNKDHFLEITPGSALDFSGMIKTPAPAGKGGRLIVNSVGRLAFESNPDVPVRFMAFNWSPGYWRYAAHKWTHKDVDRFADAVLRRGYNMVRIHFCDSFLIGYRIHRLPHKRLENVKMPQTPEEMDLDQRNLDTFLYILAAFKKRGIYLNLDLMSSRAGYTLAYPHKGNIPHEKSFKTRMFTEEKYRRHWRAAVEFLMLRKNPYTGLKLKDDPVIACIDFLNEQDLRIANGLEFFKKPFKDYLKKKYSTEAALSQAWKRNVTFEKASLLTEQLLRGNDRAAEDAGTFLISSMVEMSGWYYKTLRQIGYPGLVTHWDMIMRMMETPARALMPVIAQHSYFAHPHKVPAAKLIKKTRPNAYVVNSTLDTIVSQGSSLDSSYFRAAAAARFLDRPYMITEYSHSAFNQYRHERGLYFGSYAALQGWDALTSHANTVRITFDPFLTFESALDPISVASEAVASLAFMRGDVKEAPHSVELKLNRETLFPKNYLSSIGDDYAKLALVTKIGLSYSAVKPFSPVGTARPSLILTPQEFAYLNVTQWYAKADNKGGGESEALFSLLRKKKILSAANQSDPEKGLYYSETGELALDAKKETMQVVAPRLEGAILKKNQRVKLGAVDILSCSCPAAITIASLDARTGLKDAKRILLVVATNAFNSGMIFSSKSMSICYESGDAPALMKSVKTEIKLKNTNAGAPKMYALNMDGSREAEIPVSCKDGVLQIFLDTSKLKYGTPYFEIEYK